MRIKIGVKGFGPGGGSPVTIGEAKGSLRIMWVEIDGRRYEDIFTATTDIGPEVHTTSVTFFGAPEIVYLDRFGGELGDVPSPEWVRSVQDELDSLKAGVGKRGRHEA